MSHNQTVIRDFKRGATFAYSGFKTLPEGNWSAACHAKDTSGSLVQTFDVTLTPPVDPETRHGITIRAESDDTAAWVEGTLKADIVFYDDSVPAVKVPTSTFLIQVIGGQTDV